MPADSPLGASPVTDRSITHLWDHCASYLLCIVKCVIKGELKLKLKLGGGIPVHTKHEAAVEVRFAFCE